LHNRTSQRVVVEGVRARMTLEAIKGPWLQKLGEPYEAGNVPFGPGIVEAGTDLTINVTIPSACTNGKSASATGGYGDYLVRLDVVTTAGTFTIEAGYHKIVIA
jgi:hypothetical protein